jgi:hypothetical protein
VIGRSAGTTPTSVEAELGAVIAVADTSSTARAWLFATTVGAEELLGVTGGGVTTVVGVEGTTLGVAGGLLEVVEQAAVSRSSANGTMNRIRGARHRTPGRDERPIVAGMGTIGRSGILG